MGEVIYLDTILVPVSLLIIGGYHSYLCYFIKNKPSSTTFGIDKLKRTAWCLNLNQEGDDKKATLVVQSLRNTLMGTILTANIAIIMSLALAAVTNAAYTSSHNHHVFGNNTLSGSKTDVTYALKYASASLVSVMSFLCSSMAIGSLIEANFLVNVGDDDGDNFLSEGYILSVIERGFTLALIGNRVLCSSVALLMWMLGPLPVLLSSLALVWGLHHLDFISQFPPTHNISFKYSK